MKGKYTIWDRIDSVCQETANHLNEFCPFLVAFSFWIGGFACVVAAVERNITSREEITRLAVETCARSALIMFALAVVGFLFISWCTGPTSSKMDAILRSKEKSDLLFSGHAFYVRDGLAEDGWLFLTKKEIVYVPAATRMSVIDSSIFLCELIIAIARADKGNGTNRWEREKKLSLDMVADVKRKNRYFPSNKVVITTNGGWDITFRIKNKDEFLSCFGITPAAQTQMAHD